MNMAKAVETALNHQKTIYLLTDPLIGNEYVITHATIQCVHRDSISMSQSY